MTRRRRRRRPAALPRTPAALLAVLAAALLAALVVVGTSVPVVVEAVGAEDPGTRPVMVLGGAPVRLERALGLAGVAGTDGAPPGGARELVVSAGAIDDLIARGGGCDAEGVTCVTPEPSSTYGEALAAATLVRERGWGELTVVTSDFHVGRTRWLFGRCVDAEVTVVAAGDPAAAPLDAWRVVRESAALARSRVLGHCR